MSALFLCLETRRAHISFELHGKCEAGLQLDRALELAKQAADELSASLARTQLDRVTNEKFANFSLLVATWDTIGWIHVKRGDLEKGKPYLESAWASGQSEEMAEHLAFLYGKLGNTARATEFRKYASSLKSLNAPDSGPRRISKPESASTGTLQEMRTIRLSAKNKKSLTADLYLLIGPSGVEDVRFLDEETSLATWKDALLKAKAPGTFPDSTPSKLLRRGVLSCSEYSGECMVVLLPLGTARAE